MYAIMLAYLHGTLFEKHPNQVIVDVNGVGYDVTIPVSTFSALPEAGKEVKLRIHTHVREDAIALFGFATPEEKGVFEKLITVSGIGPKLGITVLSGLSAPDLVAAIRAGDTARLVRIPGVGKKTAERIALELRDKLDLLPGATEQPDAVRPTPRDAVERDVLSALLNLGCQRPVAEKAIAKARDAAVGGEFEALFRKAMEYVR